MRECGGGVCMENAIAAQLPLPPLRSPSSVLSFRRSSIRRIIFAIDFRRRTDRPADMLEGRRVVIQVTKVLRNINPMIVWFYNPSVLRYFAHQFAGFFVNCIATKHSGGKGALPALSVFCVRFLLYVTVLPLIF